MQKWRKKFLTGFKVNFESFDRYWPRYRYVSWWDIDIIVHPKRRELTVVAIYFQYSLLFYELFRTFFTDIFDSRWLFVHYSNTPQQKTTALRNGTRKHSTAGSRVSAILPVHVCDAKLRRNRRAKSSRKFRTVNIPKLQLRNRAGLFSLRPLFLAACKSQ